jgi:uncharacterized MAPEG superfamily protein
MTIPQWVLLGFSGWTLLILSGPIGIYRWSMILGGRAKVSDWRADKIQGSDWYQRAMRAHMNCVENLPVFAAIVLCATAAETTGPLLSWLSLAFIAARIFQTTTHILFEQTDRVASVRFGFFFVQLICMLIMSGRVAVSAAEQTMSERSSLSASMEFCPTPRIPRGMSSHPDGSSACLASSSPRSSLSSAGH